MGEIDMRRNSVFDEANLYFVENKFPEFDSQVINIEPETESIGYGSGHHVYKQGHQHKHHHHKHSHQHDNHHEHAHKHLQQHEHVHKHGSKHQHKHKHDHHHEHNHHHNHKEAHEHEEDHQHDHEHSHKHISVSWRREGSDTLISDRRTVHFSPVSSQVSFTSLNQPIEFEPSIVKPYFPLYPSTLEYEDIETGAWQLIE